VERPADLHPNIDPGADVRTPIEAEDEAMSFTDYLIDGALVLLVLLQIKPRPLTTHSLLRPLIIVSVAVVSYFNGLPTAGNDLVLVGALGLLGLMLGTAAGQATFVSRREDGVVVARAGWAAGILWVLGMGARFAFLVWINHSGASALATFSAHHSITGADAWTDALLAMAVAEVAGRTAVLAARRHRVASTRIAAIA
jgi:hypothetical protein